MPMKHVGYHQLIVEGVHTGGEEEVVQVEVEVEGVGAEVEVEDMVEEVAEGTATEIIIPIIARYLIIYQTKY